MRIAFLGDIAFVGRFDLTQNKSAREYLSWLKKELNDYDYVVANLESPLTDRTHSMVCKSMHLRSSRQNAELLQYIGVNAVSLANNHMLDFGRKGLEDTITVLNNAGIAWYGVDGKTHTTVINGEKIVFSGFCCYSTNGVGYIDGKRTQGINLLNLENIKEQLKKDKDDGAFSVLSIHWGLEHTNYPAIEHIKLADKITKIKPVVIHGHHTHTVQGIKKENGSVAAFSQGNAVFDKTTSINGRLTIELNEENKKSFILGVTIQDGKIVSTDEKGFRISENGVEEYDIHSMLEQISAPLYQITDMNKYEEVRRKQYNAVLQSKFGKHDLKWLLSRFNYYAIGAKILSYKNKKAYQPIRKQFMEG